MRTNPERFAWAVTLVAFAVFLLTCGSAAYFVQWYIFQSSTAMPFALVAARGTVGTILPQTEEPLAVSDRRLDLQAGTIVRTDSNSQALLTFSDPGTGQPVVSLVLHRDSELEVTYTRAPRFSLNQNPYKIQVRADTGRTEILVLQTEGPTAQVELVSPQAFIRMSRAGHYLIAVSEQGTRVTARTGVALVVERATGRPLDLGDGQRSVIETHGDELRALEAERNLIMNSDFAQDFETGWDFYNDREPPGTAYNAVFDGRPVAVIDRSQENWPNLRLGHGETGLVQFLDTDISDHDYLELRATFYVQEQSLSTCGVAGSECPMMVRMVYDDINGTEQVYIHGFYANHDPAQGWPLACATCRTDHERIALNSWYTFESGNLMALLPSELRPARVRQVSFYASGHAYKIYVSEIALLVAE